MKQRVKQLTALVLALAMSLSLLSANVWATEPMEDASVSPLSSEEVAAGDDSEAEDTPDDEIPESVECSTPSQEPDARPEESSDECELTGEAEIDVYTEENVSDEESSLTTQGAIASGSCGENVTWSFDEASGTLTISGTGDMSWDIYSIAPWDDYSSSITKVVVMDGVTSIEEEAFYDYSSLKKVIISGSVTSIGNYAFLECRSLAEVSMTNNVTRIGEKAFGFCDSLTSITIPNSVTSIENGAFECCESLTCVNIPNGVTSIGKSAFQQCDSLTRVTIPKSVRSIGEYSFASFYHNDMTSIFFCGEAPEICNDAFYGTTAAVYYPCNDSTWTDEVMQDYGGNITWKEWDPTSVSENNDETAVEVQKTKINGECGKNLTWRLDSEGTLTIRGTGKMFNYGSVSEQPWYDYRKRITSVVIENGVTSIGQNAFWTMDTITDVKIPDSVTTIGNGAFCVCTSLSSIVLPNSITQIGENAFGWCSSLKSVKLSNSITTINSSTFEGCESLKSIIIPNSVTSIETEAFSECRNLNSITIPDSVKDIKDGAFFKCNNLVNLVLPNSITSVRSYTFYDCFSLESIIIPDSVTSIQNYAFCNCSNLSNIDIPANITSIDYQAFINCSNLSTVHYYGNAPQIADDSFLAVTATAYYPTGNKTWTTSKRQNYGGHIAWKEWVPKAKEENYSIKHRGVYYLSTVYNDLFNDNEWYTVEETTIKSGKFDWANAVVSLITANDGDSNALGRDMNNPVAIERINLFGSVVSMVHGFVTGGREGIKYIKVKYETNGLDNRMIMMYGTPIESAYAGKTLWLSDILNLAHPGEAAYVIHSGEDEDALIRKCFKGLNKSGKYSMQITYCDYKSIESSPYKYSIVIGQDKKIYQYPIIHNGTKMEVYYKPDNGKPTFAFDATPLIYSEKAEIDSETANDILTALEKGDINSSAKDQNIMVKDIIIKEVGSKSFRLSAKAKTKLTYSGKNNKVAQVNPDGQITIRGIGTAKIRITAQGTEKYKQASKTIAIRVIPTKTTLSSVSNVTKQRMTVKWKRNTTGRGYQLQYSTDKNFKKNNKKIIIRNNATTAKTISSLEKKKTYYMRIRSYKKVNNHNYYSGWSKMKKVKITK